MSERSASVGRSRGVLLRAAALALLLLGGSAMGSPYRPIDDDTVLEHVPARTALDRLAPLRQEVAAHPADLPASLALAQGYIEIGRHDADPRFVAYAEAVLRPWSSKPNPPEPALVLQATALQYLHQFSASLALLDEALARQPLDAQAWLTRAALLELQGRYSEARRACARLARTADELIALTCLTSVDSRAGKLASSYAALRSVPSTDPRLPPAVRTWALSVLADMAERGGDDAAAEADLKAALSVAPDDPYLRASDADLLLRLDRPAEVITLLNGSEAQDPLLLRLAIAGKRMGHSGAKRWAALYQERLAAARRDRDNTHRREEAMFLLEVAGDAEGALEAAAANWTEQREPADVRIYTAAAAGAGSRADLRLIESWIATTRYEDRTLPPMSAPAERRFP